MTREEQLRVARMLREHARHQRVIADAMEAANPGDNYVGLANGDEADDADYLADLMEAGK